MKLRILLAMAMWSATMLTATAQAQVSLGLKGGWNFASLNGVSSISSGTKNRSGYNVGAYAMIKLTKIAIQPEVLYSQQGVTYSYSGSDYGSEINYVNVPVLLKFYLVEGLNFQAGPQVGFVTKATGSLRDLTTGAITTGQDVKPYLNPIDFSFAVGAGFDLPFGLNFTARYNIGISDINKYTNGDIPGFQATWMGTSAAKNQVFQFSIGYRLFKFGS